MSTLAQILEQQVATNNLMMRLCDLLSKPKTEHYSAIEACASLGILTRSKASAQKYIKNAFDDGMLPNSSKVGNKWSIDRVDLMVLRQRIQEGNYKPVTKKDEKDISINR